MRLTLLFILVSLVGLGSTGCSSSSRLVRETPAEMSLDEVSGTIVMELKETALGIGAVRGKGVLTYRGRDHAFKVRGIDYGSLSLVTLQTTGTVVNLKNLEDFEGVYFQGKASLSVGDAGKSGLFLINRKGVRIKLSSHQEKGFDLTLGRGGVKITLLKEK